MSEIVETRAGSVRGAASDGVDRVQGHSVRRRHQRRRTLPPAPTAAALGGRPRLPRLRAVVPADGGRRDDRPGAPGGDRAAHGRVEPRAPTGEDCLVLNVWTPATDDARASRARVVARRRHGGRLGIVAAVRLHQPGAQQRCRRRRREPPARRARASSTCRTSATSSPTPATSGCSTSSPRSSGCATTSRRSAATVGT